MTFGRVKNISELRRCATEILEKSTALPFRWYGKSYKCFYCMTTFTEASHLKDHAKEEHSDAKHANVVKNYLYNYKPIYVDISDLSCKICCAITPTLDDFFDHMSNAHNANHTSDLRSAFIGFKLTDGKVSCLFCGMVYDYFGSLLNHIHKSHERSGCLLCHHCGKGFQRQSLLVRHIKGIHEKTGYHCRYCDKQFQKEHQCRYHEASVHKERNLKCPQCPEKFYGNNQRLHHLRIVHKQDCVSCEKCGKQFPVRSQLVYHDKRVHLKEKNSVCGICGRTFFGEANLKLHMVSHVDDKPFSCRYCKKHFARKRTVAIHERIHTNDKRCVCKICGEAFVQTTSLNLHMKKHWSVLNRNVELN